jgi:hypothetical protein
MGPVVLSVKYYCDSDSHIRIGMRLTSGTTHRLMVRQQQQPSPVALARMVCPEISLATLQPVLCPKASELLRNYDEHVLVNNVRFWVIMPGSRHNPSTFTFTVALVRQLAAVREDLALQEN